MTRGRRVMLCIVLCLLFLGASFLWEFKLSDLLLTLRGRQPDQRVSVVRTPERDKVPGNGRYDPGADPLAELRRIAPAPVSLEDRALLRGDHTLPPSPPLPVVPAESDQEQRREAFQLQKSIDHIVLKDETFEIDGQKYSIAEIERQMRGESLLEHYLPNIRETEVGSSIRRPISTALESPMEAPVYYGVRLVRPGENIWNIHYAIIGEYLTRRHVILPPTADEPHADGHSSGVGRLLKFIEGVVFVYNLDERRVESDLNLIQPRAILVFFKISDVFAALDQLQPEDFGRLRYVSGFLRVERPEETRDLLNRRTLRE